MSLNFVKTSVLSSSDGIDFANEQRVESDETKQVWEDDSDSNLKSDVIF